MAIPTSKPLTMSTVQTEYGGSNPINMSEYYGKGNAPASGQIDLWADFNGTSNIITYNQKSFADEYLRFPGLTDVTSTYEPKISNETNNQYISAGGSVDTNETYARNTALESSVGSASNVVTVRKCVMYVGGYVNEGVSFNSSVRARATRADGSIISGATATSGNPSGQYNLESYDMLANESLQDVKEFIANGGDALLGWLVEESNQPRLWTYYVDLDFDYQP